jgi:hypothetical protein
MRRLHYPVRDTMDERTDTIAPQHRMRFELIFGSVWLAIGFFLLPALIFWVGAALLGPYGEGQGAGMGTFFGDFYGDLAQGEVRTWALALGPLALVSLIRAVFIGTRPKTEIAAPPEQESPAARRPVEPRRVEPRIGAD